MWYRFLSIPCYNERMTAFLCPICRERLNRTSGSAVCTNGHVFDFAKEGYLNLLTAGEKNSLDPGDNKDMVLARKNFLDGDYYLPLAQEVDGTLTAYLGGGYSLLDAGVGTGYYLSHVTGAGKKAGVDISKHAVRYAAKKNKDAECAVASVYSLPFADESFDAVTCVFSPYAYSEYKRVLKRGGKLIVVSPRENHLVELRKRLYTSVRAVDNKAESEELKKIEDKAFTFRFEIEKSEDVSALVKMTPYAYRAPKEKIEELSKLGSLSLTADFWISVFEK